MTLWLWDALPSDLFQEVASLCGDLDINCFADHIIPAPRAPQVYFGAHGHSDGLWLDADALLYDDVEQRRVLVYPGEGNDELGVGTARKGPMRCV